MIDRKERTPVQNYAMDVLHGMTNDDMILWEAKKQLGRLQSEQNPNKAFIAALKFKIWLLRTIPATSRLFN